MGLGLGDWMDSDVLSSWQTWEKAKKLEDYNSAFECVPYIRGTPGEDAQNSC